MRRLAAIELPSREFRKRALAMMAAVGCMLAGAQPGFSAEVKDYGKPGSPVDMVVGYQPYYTESWSGVIMRNKKFYEKYLPQGSKIDFQVGLQGAIIVNGMLAGKVDLGYVGDMPGIVSTSHSDVRDIRMVSVLGLGYDQCNAFLVRTDAPQFQSSDEAIAWLNGKTVAVPKGSCTDRFAQAVFKRFKIAPSEYLNQSIEVITSGFRAKKLDAAVMWEPTTSRLVLDKLARKIATGASVNENDGGFMVMPKALIDQRPDIVDGWLEAELDAQLFFADEKNAMAVSAMALEQRPASRRKRCGTRPMAPIRSRKAAQRAGLCCPYLQPGGEGAHRQGGEIPGGDQKHQGRHPARSDDAGVYRGDPQEEKPQIPGR